MNRAATPISVPGASDLTPSFAKARVRPSLSGEILSTVQSTTYVVSFATLSKVPPTAARAAPMLR